MPANANCSSSTDSSNAMGSDGGDSASEVNHNLFCQQNFLFLFDNEMNFSKREGFDQMNIDLTAEDFIQMRKINRQELLQFLE
jgi:hypothetical protein